VAKLIDNPACYGASIENSILCDGVVAFRHLTFPESKEMVSVQISAWLDF
jgi:hypothetical protein